MAKDLAIVLNNGSINSAVTTALASQKYRPIMLYAEVAPQPFGSRQAHHRVGRRWLDQSERQEPPDRHCSRAPR